MSQQSWLDRAQVHGWIGLQKSEKALRQRETGAHCWFSGLHTQCLHEKMFYHLPSQTPRLSSSKAGRAEQWGSGTAHTTQLSLQAVND